MKTIFENLLKNWKTTLGGLLIFICLTLQKLGYITPEVLSSVTVLLTALGLIAAKDSNRTGV